MRNRNRVSARFRPGGLWTRLSALASPRPASGVHWGAAERGKMTDSAGERTRLRRYPELPVWVVEDHQEVSGRRRSLPALMCYLRELLCSRGAQQNYLGS